VSIEENKALVRRLIDEIVGKANLAIADELIASDFVLRSPGRPDVRGREGYKQFCQAYFNAFPDLRMSVEEQIAEGDNVVTRWSSTGTHRGEVMGVPPTGKQVSMTGIVIYRCAGGRIVEEVEELDLLGVMQQLGAIPPAARPAGASA
jgi:steroid delta-isomerase-like uncharacterized protein